MTEFIQPIAGKLHIKTQQVETVLNLLAEGATIPFIARYRKDKTGALDEVQIQQIQDEAKFLKEFAERKAFIEKTITELGKMTETLQDKLNKATTLVALEDIYLPYKVKRKTRAQIAKENGLEPLATLLMEQKEIDVSATFSLINLAASANTSISFCSISRVASGANPFSLAICALVFLFTL